jgi:propionyl-CoA carboxylase beta chain
MNIRQDLLDDLIERRKRLQLGGGSERIEKQRAKGCLTARDRMSELFDSDTFQEWGMHVDHGCHDFGMEQKSLPCDGVVTGVGRIEGRPIAAYSQDATVGGGALGQRHAKKICDVMDYALEAGIPFIGINDSGGARIQEAVESLSGFGQVFYRNVMLSGCIPQVFDHRGQLRRRRGILSRVD